MGMLGDIAAASGNSISEIAAAFSKVQAKGKVELENLNQLAERGIPIFAELKKVTGDANMEFGAGRYRWSSTTRRWRTWQRRRLCQWCDGEPIGDGKR